MDRREAYEKLRQKFSDLIITDEPLSTHTYFRIGGPADLFCRASSADDLAGVLDAARELGVPYVLIGEGSNLLVDDRGYRGLIVQFMSGEPPQMAFPLLTVHAGNSLASALDFAASRSLSGLENMAGIPGTIGGAIYMNAGAYGTSVSDILHEAHIVTAGLEERIVDSSYFDFAYRRSSLQEGGDIVVSVTLKLRKGRREDIIAEYNRIKAIRAEKHPGPDLPCAGSYFKNLPPEVPGGRRRPAGYFLDQAGAGAMRVGGAAVFHKHANMIINTGSASARDVLVLADKMKQAVRERFGIELEEEVRYLDAEEGIVSGERKIPG